jgi:hypothetical protein
MPNQPDLTGWMSLLTACRTHGNREVGKKSFYRISEQDLSYAGGYDFMADIYADAQDMEIASKIQELRSRSKAWKKPGKAWMEIGNNVYEFIVGDKTHPQNDGIQAKWETLCCSMKKRGYLPNLDAVTDQMSGKEDMECNNSTLTEIHSLTSLEEKNVTYNDFHCVHSISFCVYFYRGCICVLFIQCIFTGLKEGRRYRLS